MKNMHSAGVIVYRLVDHKIEYLLLQYNAHHWDFSKGGIETHETKKDAALRELKEEAGISATIIPDFEEKFSYIFNDYDKQLAHKTVYFFIGKTIEHQITLSHEHINYAWLDYNKAYKTLTYDNAKHVLNKAHAFIISL
jgi:bis(5'-nucleosidyl)-tetraphosphatase